jgi:hypothetical protein
LKPGHFNQDGEFENVRYEVPDGKVRGLLIVQPAPSGVKSWAVRYRYNGKPRKLTIGRYSYPEISLETARSSCGSFFATEEEETKCCGDEQHKIRRRNRRSLFYAPILASRRKPAMTTPPGSKS